jgi:hypothetical protein
MTGLLAAWLACCRFHWLAGFLDGCLDVIAASKAGMLTGCVPRFIGCVLYGRLVFWLVGLVALLRVAAWPSAIAGFAGLAGLSEFVGLLCLLAVWIC